MAKYMTKYICKDMQMIFGSFYLAGGNGLVREAPYFLTDMDYESFEAQSESYCVQTDTSYKYFDSSNFKPGIPEEFCDDIFELV